MAWYTPACHLAAELPADQAALLARAQACGSVSAWTAARQEGWPQWLPSAPGCGDGPCSAAAPPSQLTTHPLFPADALPLPPGLQMRPPAPAHRKVRFVHVKINRAHCRATYEGYPL